MTRRARVILALGIAAVGLLLGQAAIAGLEGAPARSNTGPLTVTGASSVASVGKASSLSADGAFATPNGWTPGAKWSVASGSATHAAPDPGRTTLSGATTATAGGLYQIALTIARRTAGSISVALGSADAGASLSGNAPHTVYVRTLTQNPPLVITPTQDFDGAVTAIAVYPMIPAAPDVVVNPSDGTLSPLEIYAGGSDRKSMFLGTYSGQMEHSVGPSTGVHNTGVGFAALMANTEGMQNTAVGYWALKENTTGNTNTALGNGALDGNLTGNNNVAIGHHCNYRNIDQSNNVAIGWLAMTNANGPDNVAVGYASLSGRQYSAGNPVARSTAIGANAGLFSIGTGSISLGYGAGFGADPAKAPETDDYGILIGYNASRSVPTAQKLSNYIGIGNGTLIDASNQVKIGNPAITETDLYGHLQVNGKAPTLANCGTGASPVSGTDVGGSFTMGAGNPSHCTVTFSTPWGVAPSCIINNQTTATAARVSAITPTGFTVTLAKGESSDVLNYICVGRQ